MKKPKEDPRTILYIRKVKRTTANKLKMLALQHGLKMGAMLDRLLERAK